VLLRFQADLKVGLYVCGSRPTWRSASTSIYYW